MATVSPGSMVKLDVTQHPVPLARIGGLAAVSAIVLLLRLRHAAVGKPYVVELDAPRPARLLGCCGETTCGCVSSSLKTRSLAAMADCRMLYFSLRS